MTPLVCCNQGNGRDGEEDLAVGVDLLEALDEPREIVAYLVTTEIDELVLVWIELPAGHTRRGGIDGAVPSRSPSLRQTQREDEPVGPGENLAHIMKVFCSTPPHCLD